MTEKIKPTPDSTAESLTGWDEMAINQLFGVPAEAMSDRPVLLFRALAFTLYRRDGMGDRDAYKWCMNLTMREVMDIFDVSGVESDEGTGEDVTEGVDEADLASGNG